MKRDAMAMLFLGLRRQGLTINEIFWGLWLFPFGVLVMRSGFLPRVLGVWLIVNCFAYLALSFTGLLLPQHQDMAFRIASPVRRDSDRAVASDQRGRSIADLGEAAPRRELRRVLRWPAVLGIGLHGLQLPVVQVKVYPESIGCFRCDLVCMVRDLCFRFHRFPPLRHDG